MSNLSTILIKNVVSNPRYALLKIWWRTSISRDEEFGQVWNQVVKITGWLSKSEAYLLFFLSRKCSPNHSIVEIGSYEGRSTVAIASGASREIYIYAIDPHSGDKTEVEAGIVVNTYSAFLANTKAFPNVIPVRKLSQDATRDIGEKKIELLFIDGWHSEEAVNADIENYLPICSDQFTMVFDDWHLPEIQSAIMRNLGKLPPVVGTVGKTIIFSNNREFTRSWQFINIKRSTSRKTFKKFLID